ncbi:MAG: hypothetical protein LAO07_14445 [Acidobacteriia bacterium]|nr:hypothetical protein [Terriglobia bacterium]
MYRVATGHYLLELESTGAHLSIRLKPSALERFPWVSLTYPTTSVACSQAARLGSVPQTPCIVPVNVWMPNLSLLPQAAEDTLTRQWKEDLASNKYLTKDRQWNTLLQSLSLLGNLKNTLPIKIALLDELAADAFVAHDERNPVHVPSVVTYSGPHRIVFVVENHKKTPAGARKIESTVITSILSKARPEDSFALLTTRGPRAEIPFGSSRNTLRAAAEKLALPPQRGPGGEGVLDAILEATRWFQPPQPGDSIFLMSMDGEGRNKAGYSKVQAALSAARVRVFAIRLVGDIDAFSLSYHLGRASGGWASKGLPWQGPRSTVTDERLQEIISDAQEMYMEATEHYLLNLDSFGPHLTIGLTEATLNQYPWAEVHYPRDVRACSNTKPGD